jgi:glycosyltransferase involved in cell wall biosynthesis
MLVTVGLVKRLGIGLPVYNGERYLAQTLESLRAQTYDDFEVLILDNASTDSTPALARAIVDVDRRFRYERKEMNTGGPSNFNDVFARMDNDLYAWVAADDVYDPAYFAATVELLDRSPEAIAAFSRVSMVDGAGTWLRDVDDPAENARWSHRDPSVRFADVIRSSYGCREIFSVYRREALKNIEPMCNCWGSDRMKLAEIALHGRIVHVPQALFSNREHPDRITRRPQRDRRYLGHSHAPRAITFHYASHLRRSIRRAPLTRTERDAVRRAYGRWALANTGNFARSAGRAVIETARPLLAR